MKTSKGDAQFNAKYNRWKEENGFNAWTNDWGILKHVFHNDAEACDSMIGLIFIAIIGISNFRLGNLRRGARYVIGKLINFLDSIRASYRAIPIDLRTFVLNYIAPLSTNGS